MASIESDNVPGTPNMTKLFRNLLCKALILAFSGAFISFLAWRYLTPPAGDDSPELTSSIDTSQVVAYGMGFCSSAIVMVLDIMKTLSSLSKTHSRSSNIENSNC